MLQARIIGLVQIVQPPNLISALEKQGNDLGADEPCAAGDQISSHQSLTIAGDSMPLERKALRVSKISFARSAIAS